MMDRLPDFEAQRRMLALLMDNPDGLTRQQIVAALGIPTAHAGGTLQKLRCKGLVHSEPQSDGRPSLWKRDERNRAEVEAEEPAIIPPKGEWPAHARFDAPGMIVEPKRRPLVRRGGDVTARFLGDPVR